MSCRRKFVPLLFSLFLFLLISACNDLDSAGNINQPERPPEGAFGVSETFGGPYLGVDNPVTDPADAPILEVEPGGTFYARAVYESLVGITDITVSLVNATPEGLAGPLDPTQSFFTLGAPTSISEPGGGCELTGEDAEVICIYEIQVAEDAVNVSELEGAEGEFAYIFTSEATNAAGVTSDEDLRAYVRIVGDGAEEPEPKPEPVVCTDPVEIPDEAMRQALFQNLEYPDEITCEALIGLERFEIDFFDVRFIDNFEGLQYATNLKVFTVTGFSVTPEQVAFLSNLTDLESLRLSLIVEDESALSFLANLTNLETLLIRSSTEPGPGEADRGQPILDLSPLQNLTELTDLFLSYFTIDDLSPLQNLTNLSDVELNVNNIDDISAFIANEGLGEGDSISLTNNRLETCPGTEDRADIDALIERGVEVKFDDPVNCDGEGGGGQEPCTNPVNIPDEVLRTQLRKALGLAEDAEITCSDLADLTIFEYTVDRDDPDPIIESLEGLQYAVNLEEIDLFSNSVSDLSPLRNLPVLTKLDLSGNDVFSLEPLSDSKSLRSLAVEDIADLSPLGNLTGLLNLSISTPDPSPDNLAVLGQLINLQDLSLTNSAVSDLSFTQSLDALKELELRGNNLSTLESIGDLPSLEQLVLNRNPIQDVTPLADLPQGLTLSLGVPLDDLKGLSELTNLGAIQGGFFSGTKDISQLAALKQLVAVSLPFEQITDITPLAELKQLVALDLSGNQITDITPLSGLTNLCYVQLGTNTIEDIEPLVISSDNGGFSRNGCFIDLDTNPLSTDPGSKAREDIDTLRSRGIRVNYGPYPAE